MELSRLKNIFLLYISLCMPESVCFGTLPTAARQVLCLWDSPGRNTGLGCNALLQRIFLTQEPRDQTLVSCIKCIFFTTEPIRKPNISLCLLWQWADGGSVLVLCFHVCVLCFNVNMKIKPLPCTSKKKKKKKKIGIQ